MVCDGFGKQGFAVNDDVVLTRAQFVGNAPGLDAVDGPLVGNADAPDSDGVIRGAGTEEDCGRVIVFARLTHTT